MVGTRRQQPKGQCLGNKKRKAHLSSCRLRDSITQKYV